MVKWNWQKSRIIFPRENEHLVYWDFRDALRRKSLCLFREKLRTRQQK